MLKKTRTYEDFDGNKRTEDFYFNLTKAELIELQASENGGLEKLIKKIIDEQDQSKLISLFKEIICKAYGEKSLDGKRFIKSQEITEAFTQTTAYSDLFMELVTDTDKASEFIIGLIPKDLAGEVEKEMKKQNLVPLS